MANQSFSALSTFLKGIFTLSFDYISFILFSGSSQIAADVNVLFRIHASVNYKAFYGLNVTNSAILNNTGNGVCGKWTILHSLFCSDPGNKYPGTNRPSQC
jgi:hypothetical protein